MNLAQKYARNGFREIRPGINIYEESEELENFRKQAIDNFHRMNRTPGMARTLGKFVWWMVGMCVLTLIAAAFFVGLYEVLRTFVTGRM